MADVQAPAPQGEKAYKKPVVPKDDNLLAILAKFFAGLVKPEGKFGEAPALKLSGEKGPPKVEQVIRIEGGKKEEIKDKPQLKSSQFTSLLSREAREKAASVASTIYQKESASDSDQLKEFTNTFGEEATEILKGLQYRHKVYDPFEVAGDFKPTQWEERWVLEEDSRDTNGEAKLKELAAILKAKGKLFEDPFFPANSTSLFADPKRAAQHKGAGQSTERFDQDPFLADTDLSTIKWLRPSEIRPNKTAKIYSGIGADKIDPNDVQQGKIGNCYFLAAIASCGVGESDALINDLCVEETQEQGMFGVKFFLNGKWITVVVDDRLPCQQGPYGEWDPIFAKPKSHVGQDSSEYELWPMIFEKAWAKLHLSYEVTAAGFTADTTNYLTGGTVTTVDLEWSAAEADEKDQWTELVKYFSQAQNSVAFLSCNVRPDIPVDGNTLMNQYGLINGHAYSLLTVQQSKVQRDVRLVRIRNPWGTVEWKGRYCDKSNTWTPSLKQEFGWIDEDDGTFFMDFNDFCYFFGTVSVCDPAAITRYTEDKKCRVDVYEGQWIKGQTAGGHCRLRGNTCFKHNPVCVLTVRHPGPVEISMYQPDTRPLETTTNVKLMSIELMLIDEETGKSDRIIESRQRFACYLFRDAVPGKRYHLVACAWAVGVESTFWITASGQGCELEEYKDRAEPTALEEKTMRMDNPRQECCTVCLVEDGADYYSKDGLRCEGCRNKTVGEDRYTKPGEAAKRPAPAAAEPEPEPEVLMCKYCKDCERTQEDCTIKGEVLWIGDDGPYHSPPCWKAPDKCYYCKSVCTSDYVTTQYGPLCGYDARRFGCI